MSQDANKTKIEVVEKPMAGAGEWRTKVDPERLPRLIRCNNPEGCEGGLDAARLDAMLRNPGADDLAQCSGSMSRGRGQPRKECLHFFRVVVPDSTT